MSAPHTFRYAPWRHGGWYVLDVRYPDGACGCVSRNYADRKWRIACDPRPFDQQPTFKTRAEAARAEWDLAAELARVDGAHRLDTETVLWRTEYVGQHRAEGVAA